VAVAWVDAGGVTAGTLAGGMLGNRAVVPGGAEPGLMAAADGTALIFASGTRIGLVRPVHPGAEPVFFLDGGKPVAPRAGPSGDGIFAVWEDDAGGNEHETVLLTRVDRGGKAAPSVPVPSEAGSANAPDVATVGGYAAVVYYQFRDGPSHVYLSMFGQDLRRAGDDLAISGKHARFPRVAAGNGTLGVVYALAEGPARMALLRCR
jgi:hypothetical protein